MHVCMYVGRRVALRPGRVNQEVRALVTKGAWELKLVPGYFKCDCVLSPKTFLPDGCRYGLAQPLAIARGVAVLEDRQADPIEVVMELGLQENLRHGYQDAHDFSIL